MTVDELPDYLRAHWYELREHLLSGAYRPSMVKQQLIPRGNGEMRKLGIPTVVDRFIQQAILQVLQSTNLHTGSPFDGLDLRQQGRLHRIGG
jgi:retron-type reverse transcriptase